MTRTYATLEVSSGTFKEVAAALSDAGYEQAFDHDATGGPVIDMHGLALVERVEPETLALRDGSKISLRAPWPLPGRRRA